MEAGQKEQGLTSRLVVVMLGMDSGNKAGRKAVMMKAYMKL